MIFKIAYYNFKLLRGKIKIKLWMNNIKDDIYENRVTKYQAKVSINRTFSRIIIQKN